MERMEKIDNKRVYITAWLGQDDQWDVQIRRKDKLLRKIARKIKLCLCLKKNQRHSEIKESRASLWIIRQCASIPHTFLQNLKCWYVAQHNVQNLWHLNSPRQPELLRWKCKGHQKVLRSCPKSLRCLQLKW